MMRRRKKVLKDFKEGGSGQEVLETLSEKERLFVETYMTNGFERTKAVLVAYNCSPKNATKMAYELLQRPAIKLAIDTLKAEMMAKTDVTADYVLKKIVKIVEQTSDEDSKQFSPTSALRGLELLAKTLGMFIDKTEISGKDGEAIKVERIRQDTHELSTAIARLAARKKAS